MSRLLLQDVRYGLRQLRRSPGFTLVAVLTLALGIGANTIIFAIVNGILLRPLPVPQPDRLVALFATHRRSGESRALSYPEYLDYRDRSGIFAGLAAQQGLPVSVGTRDRAEVVWGEIVSENYFSVLGLAPALGRTFQPQDASGLRLGSVGGREPSPAAQPLRGDREVIGKRVTLNGHGFTVVGGPEAQYPAGIGTAPRSLYLAVRTSGDPSALATPLRSTLQALGGALATTRLLTNLLFEVRPNDPTTYLVTPLALALVALVATLLPAVRATRVDPIESMRSE